MKAVDVLKNSFYGKNKVRVRGGAGGHVHQSSLVSCTGRARLR